MDICLVLDIYMYLTGPTMFETTCVTSLSYMLYIQFWLIQYYSIIHVCTFLHYTCIGGVLTGGLSDLISGRAITCVCMMYMAVPTVSTVYTNNNTYAIYL